MQIIVGTRAAPTLFYNFHIFPLRIIKQVVCMFFSANSPKFRLAHPELERFVLNRDARYAPPNIRIYAFYTYAPRSRSAGVTGLLKGSSSLGGAVNTFTFSEITFPPFGFLMAFDGPAPDDRLCDISAWSHFAYNDWRSLSMRLPILPIYTAYPADYRSQDEVEKAVANASVGH